MENTAVRPSAGGVAAVETHPAKTGRGGRAGRSLRRDSGFYDYYQIDRGDADESDRSEESEPRGKRELKGRTEGLHSPWGTIWSIATATGWTFNYIIWGIAWVNLRMMIADAPRYVTGDKVKKGPPIERPADLIEFLQ